MIGPCIWKTLPSHGENILEISSHIWLTLISCWHNSVCPSISSHSVSPDLCQHNTHTFMDLLVWHVHLNDNLIIPHHRLALAVFVSLCLHLLSWSSSYKFFSFTPSESDVSDWCKLCLSSLFSHLRLHAAGHFSRPRVLFFRPSELGEGVRPEWMSFF